MQTDKLITAQKDLHQAIVSRTRMAMASSSHEELSLVARRSPDDEIFRLDQAAESGLLDDVRRIFSTDWRVRLVCEGLEEGSVIVQGERSDLPEITLILDPIDGTRGLMYGKRSGWVLSAAAVSMTAGVPTRSSDILCAVQTEIPTPRSDLSDQFEAIRGQGVIGRCINLRSREITSLSPTPSRAQDLRGGFSTVCRFFPPGREQLAALDDALIEELCGAPDGTAPAYEDQYLSSGGLLYQLVTGRDRLVADLRGVLNGFRREAGLVGVMTCHPYDMCTSLIAEESGVLLTDGTGSPLDFPLDTTSEVSWIGYANSEIRAGVEPALLRLIPQHLGCRRNPAD